VHINYPQVPCFLFIVVLSGLRPLLTVKNEISLTKSKQKVCHPFHLAKLGTRDSLSFTENLQGKEVVVAGYSIASTTRQ
jgi:hypothetical protein